MVRPPHGAVVRLLLLSPQDAADTWKVPEAGKDELLQTRSDLFSDGDTTTLRQLDNNRFQFALYPQPQRPPEANATLQSPGAGFFTASIPPVTVTVQAAATKPAGEVPPVRLGPKLSWRPVGVAEAPEQSVWDADAAQWALHLTPAVIPPGVSNFFLRIAYTGDEARLQSEGKLLDDNFFNGQPWLIGLDRIAANRTIPPLDLLLLPIRADAPVYLPETARARIDKTGQTVSLDAVKAIPEYQLQISCKPVQEKDTP